MDPTRIVVRRIRKPQGAAEIGELVAILVETRTEHDPSVTIYSITHDRWRVEHHRQLMLRSVRATPEEREEARQQLEAIGERVRVVQASPRAMHAHD